MPGGDAEFYVSDQVEDFERIASLFCKRICAAAHGGFKLTSIEKTDPRPVILFVKGNSFLTEWIRPYTELVTEGTLQETPDGFLMTPSGESKLTGMEGDDHHL